MSHHLNTTILMLTIFSLAAGSVPLKAQESAVTPEQIRSAYRQLDYRKTVDLSERYLEAHPRIEKDILLQVLQYRAFAQVALGRDDAARSTLRSILITDPGYRLNENLASPKVKRLFAELQDESPQAREEATVHPSYVVLEDVKTQATLKSILFPGTGQRFLEQPRGYIYTGIAGASLGFFIYSAFRVPSAREDYLKANDAEQIAEKYDTYNRWYQYRNSALVAYVATWALSVTDVLIFGPSAQPVLSVQPHDSGLEFTLSFQF